MDATQEFAASLRDARKSALLKDEVFETRPRPLLEGMTRALRGVSNHALPSPPEENVILRAIP
jgi:hypothetical protein